MKECFANYLVPSVEQVLETMFFTGIVDATATTEMDCGRRIVRTVQFQGPPDGELCVGMSSETAAALVSSFLGLAPEEVTPTHCEQVTEELANMICGSVLSRYSPQSSFRLEVRQAPACRPVCDIHASLELPEGGLNICAWLDCEGQVAS